MENVGKKYWAIFDGKGEFILGTLSKTKKGAINSDVIHRMDVEFDGGAGGIGNWMFIKDMQFSVRKVLVISVWKM